MKTNRVMDEIRSTMSPEMKKQMEFYALYNASKRIKTFSESTGGIHILIASPSLVIFQKGMPYLSVYSFMRHEDSKPLATKCIGTNKPTLKRSMNCLPPSV